MNRRSAIAAINKAGVLLVFPINNRPEPQSLWSYFFPKKKMRWEWDDSADDPVVELWHLKTELSVTRKVVYTKWYQGRATYFSRELFTAFLRTLNPSLPSQGLSAHSHEILQILRSDSPLSTKDLKRMTGLQGRVHERMYTQALKQLWSHLQIAAFGEVEDGSFPSLAVGATETLFEDLWSEALQLSSEQAEKKIREILSPSNLFYRHWLKIRNLTLARQQSSTR